MTTGHAFLAPSSAPRWAKCERAPSLEAANPETEESPESLEGTAAHWVVQVLLQSGQLPALGTQAPNAVAVTREMHDGAHLVKRAVLERIGSDWQHRMFIETRLPPTKRIHVSQCWGTPDYLAWSRLPDGRLKLHIFDFKFGHRIVDVREHEQLVAYAAMAIDQAGANDLQTIVDFTIIQPRAPHRDGPVRSWMVLAADLRGLINRLASQAEAATLPDAKARPDPEACRDCRGRHACDGLQREAFHALASGYAGGAHDLTPHALGLELRSLARGQALLEARVSGLQAQAEAMLRRGDVVPFWKMSSKPGRLAWNRPIQEVQALGAMMGVELSKPDVITPTQAVAAGLPESLVKMYAGRPPSAMKLEADDGTDARLTFSSSNI